MRQLLFASPERFLQQYNYSHRRVVVNGNLFAVRYYMYSSHCVAVGQLYTGANQIVDCEDSPSGLGVRSSRLTVSPISAYDESDSSCTYTYVYLRIGCTHPNMKVGWAAMHDRRDHCPDCGFSARCDTSG
jgi:hypothetical protein